MRSPGEKSEMIRVVIKGGLGNQMFQYARAKVLSTRLQRPLLLDISYYDREKVHRSYALPGLGVQEPTTSRRMPKPRRFLAQHLATLNLCLARRGWPSLGCVYVDGYWQSERWFEGEHALVRSLFTFPKPPEPIATRIREGNSIAVHVRRGDYLNLPPYQVCGLDYYLRAMQDMARRVEHPRFFVFSDDIEWCEVLRQHWPDAVLVRDAGSDVEELLLMSLCRHTIISNSSFSWWAAWLTDREGKIVMAPDRWVNDPALNDKLFVAGRLLPDRWQRVPTMPEQP